MIYQDGDVFVEQRFSFRLENFLKRLSLMQAIGECRTCAHLRTHQDSLSQHHQHSKCSPNTVLSMMQVEPTHAPLQSGTKVHYELRNSYDFLNAHLKFQPKNHTAKNLISIDVAIHICRKRLGVKLLSASAASQASIVALKVKVEAQPRSRHLSPRTLHNLALDYIKLTSCSPSCTLFHECKDGLLKMLLPFGFDDLLLHCCIRIYYPGRTNSEALPAPTPSNSDQVTLMSASGEGVLCNRALLQHQSDVFRRMFDRGNGMTEAASLCVRLRDRDVRILRQLVAFLYDRCLAGCTPLEDLVELLAMADQYNIKSLKDVCEEKVMGWLSVDEAPWLHVMACQYHCPMLKAATADLISRHRSRIVASADWRRLHQSDPDAGRAILEYMKQDADII